MDILQHLPPKTLDALHFHGMVAKHPTGEQLFREGDPAYGMYLIMEGEVEIFRPTSHGESKLAILGPGEVFGEMGLLLESSARTASARIKSNAVLFEMPRNPIELLKLVDHDHGALIFLENLIQLLAERLRALDLRPEKCAERGFGLFLANIEIKDYEDNPKDAIEVVRRALPTGLISRWRAEKKLQAGDVLFREGEDSDCFYFIESGRMEVSREKDGELLILGELEAPSVTGELGYFTHQPRSATLTALVESRVVRFPNGELSTLKKKNPREAFELLYAVAQLIVFQFLERESG